MARARIEHTPDGSVRVWLPSYMSDDLRQMVPAQHRRWNVNIGCWTVAEEFKREAVLIVEKSKLAEVGYRSPVYERFEERKLNFLQFRWWMKHRYGDFPKRSNGRCCHGRLIKGSKCSHHDLKRNCLSPDADHWDLWTVKVKPVAITSQPYDDPDHLESEFVWATEHGLELHLFKGRGWWNEDMALLVFTALKEQK